MHKIQRHIHNVTSRNKPARQFHLWCRCNGALYILFFKGKVDIFVGRRFLRSSERAESAPEWQKDWFFVWRSWKWIEKNERKEKALWNTAISMSIFSGCRRSRYRLLILIRGFDKSCCWHEENWKVFAILVAALPVVGLEEIDKLTWIHWLRISAILVAALSILELEEIGNSHVLLLIHVRQ